MSSILPLDTLPEAFQVSTQGGEVVFEFDADVDWYSPNARKPVISMGDTVIPMPVVWKWKQVNSVSKRMSSRYVVPALAPAHYSACLPARPEFEEDEERRPRTPF